MRDEYAAPKSEEDNGRFAAVQQHRQEDEYSAARAGRGSGSFFYSLPSAQAMMPPAGDGGCETRPDNVMPLVSSSPGVTRPSISGAGVPPLFETGIVSRQTQYYYSGQDPLLLRGPLDGHSADSSITMLGIQRRRFQEALHMLSAAPRAHSDFSLREAAAASSPRLMIAPGSDTADRRPTLVPVAVTSGTEQTAAHHHQRQEANSFSAGESKKRNFADEEDNDETKRARKNNKYQKEGGSPARPDRQLSRHITSSSAINTHLDMVGGGGTSTITNHSDRQQQQELVLNNTIREHDEERARTIAASLGYSHHNLLQPHGRPHDVVSQGFLAHQQHERQVRLYQHHQSRMLLHRALQDKTRSLLVYNSPALGLPHFQTMGLSPTNIAAHSRVLHDYISIVDVTRRHWTLLKSKNWAIFGNWFRNPTSTMTFGNSGAQELYAVLIEAVARHSVKQKSPKSLNLNFQLPFLYWVIIAFTQACLASLYPFDIFLFSV
jgi:hypothetical protein